jgi:hypothetical protein
VGLKNNDDDDDDGEVKQCIEQAQSDDFELSEIEPGESMKK